MSEPNYWNRENFEALAFLASTLRADSRLDGLAAYCELREKGLRRQAFAELDTFLTQAETWSVPVQRQLALHVLQAHWSTPEAHQFLTDPLRKRFLEPVLEEWRASEGNNPIPVRHLGLLRDDRSLLEEALRINPKDDAVRGAIARNLIDCVEYATHHLVESFFIGDEGEALAALDEARAVLAGVTDPMSVQRSTQNLEELGSLLADWREYRQAPEGTFPEWCQARNRNHYWSIVIYYV